jgi:hypothetical protein
VLGAARFRGWLRRQVRLGPEQEARVLEIAEIRPLRIDAEGLGELEGSSLSPAYREAVAALQGRSFLHPWQLAEALARQSPLWRLPSGAPASARKRLDAQLELVLQTFSVSPPSATAPPGRPLEGA